jgi:hypothetical protein
MENCPQAVITQTTDFIVTVVAFRPITTQLEREKMTLALVFRANAISISLVTTL